MAARWDGLLAIELELSNQRCCGGGGTAGAVACSRTWHNGLRAEWPEGTGMHDPGCRHGHKSSSRRFDGHKAAIVVDTDSQLMAAF